MRPVPDAIANLIAMRAAGEITYEEFTAAKERLQDVNRGLMSDGHQTAVSSSLGSRLSAGNNGQPSRESDNAASKPAEPAKPRRFRKGFWAVAAVFAALIIYGSFSGSTVYKRADYGTAWPYPNYDSATVRCKVSKFGTTDRPVVTVELGGVTYGLNAPGLLLHRDPRPLEAADKSATASTTSKMISDALSNLCHWQQ
jgi:hypothetical protein